MTTATHPPLSLNHNDGRALTRVKLACLLLSFMVAGAPTASAQTLTTLVRFDQSDGGGAHSAPVQGTNGNFYGATGYGGPNADSGTMYEMTPEGSLKTLYDSSENTAALPFANFLMTANGNFYSTTFAGGSNFYGTVFELTPSGNVTILYTFCALENCLDGIYPNDPLVLGTDGNFYGTTTQGGANIGANPCNSGCGTVFKVTPKGELTTVYNFCSLPNCTDGAIPFGGLVQGANGNFYGTTYVGGHGLGTVFELTTAGKLTTLYSFCKQPKCTDGAFPTGGLVLASNGNFYGTTYLGGSSNNAGTIFEITPAGEFTSLYTFCSLANCTDGSGPKDALIQATDGNLYGTTEVGGTKNDGTVFAISPAGKLTTLYSFCSETGCADGTQPIAGLTQATNGNFYGTTSAGTKANSGTIFTLSNGLAPFAQIVPAFGKVGAAITILGNTLTGTTSVGFNGTIAAFTVVSDTEITATVPRGATTGTVIVTTPSGALNSNVAFQVLP